MARGGNSFGLSTAVSKGFPVNSLISILYAKNGVFLEELVGECRYFEKISSRGINTNSDKPGYHIVFHLILCLELVRFLVRPGGNEKSREPFLGKPDLDQIFHWD